MSLLSAAHRIREIDRLADDLAEVGDSRESLIGWLGHPLWEITPEEEKTLRGYLERAQTAKRDKKPTPYLPPNTPRTA